MRKPKKLINNRNDVAREQFDGFIAATQFDLEPVGHYTCAIRKSPIENKVAVLTGGGAGHEPMYGGYVGEGLADAVAVGDVFAAPTPDAIFETAKALNPANGVVFVYGNYAGDNMNFDIAAELLEDEGINSHTIRINDDVISACKENEQERRGIAGALFVLKIAGASATRGDSFEHVVAMTEKARQNTSSIGVALGPCAIPRNDDFNFQIADDQIEIGMGLHGEPGVGKTPLVSADTVVTQVMDTLFAEAGLVEGDEVALLINNLGASTQMELLITNRAVHHYLSLRGVAVFDNLIGSYCTSLEMSGWSISVLKLDSELKALYQAPCQSLALRR
ncbi:dihydroxyacetone kinase [Vibrio sp. 10N.286.49.C2]|uniref:dihydroxyacetone kinase subunit DhaK n=1 Tax=unclassified Vibrio TaxID=2614977 RepID=UPI000C814F38|nr:MULTISPECIES: dihydroxyacetone kinase subunit DhaK [unclassified Vibrio]PMH43419.1 dihydroxyacetone kinase [Vibrio sp. 10N.286.49.C2]PMH57071.1 dihydroxyacetone kinase [Vibrio sp. 10N.286.49.B1]PMH78551.1 dihydroxyacetone kinase [Vibrio sp. 10N.286.48.B7]